MTDGGTTNRGPDEEEEEEDLEALLEFLRESRGLDFTGYKRASLTRRIGRRMSATGVADLGEYRDLLEANPDEHVALLDTILINVTSFFRDEPAWKYLEGEVVPAIVRSREPDQPIRIWSAGCATGKEAYSLAMVFADHLGLEAFRDRVKIYATDVDEGALAQARRGLYSDQELEGVSDERREEYFERVADGFVFRADCRRSLIFGRHDLTADAPISRLDLVACRNTLMYLLAETQRRVLERFHYALVDGGFLFLGRAETIFSHSDLFVPVNPSLRVFARAPGVDRSVGARHVRVDGGDREPAAHPGSSPLERLAMAATPVAQLVVDLDGILVGANTKARSMFAVTSGDIGRPFRDLEVSYRPVELRSRIEQALAGARVITLNDVKRHLPDDGEQHFDVRVVPLAATDGVILGVAVTFADVTDLGRARDELERSQRELQKTNQDLETSNEELQSTNEELETTNEELQSANEELETMNEELQSANEQLETMNEQLVRQSGDIERADDFLYATIDGLDVAIAVLDGRFDVVAWNLTATDMFGVAAEVASARSILTLGIGLPVAELAPILQRAVDAEPGTSEQVTLDGTDRSGRSVRWDVTVKTLRSGDDAALLLMIAQGGGGG